MLVTLKRDSDPARVQASLQGLGLWAERLDSRSGAPAALLVASHSAGIDPDRIASIEGVAEICRFPSRHPRVDALAGSPIAVGATRIGGDEAPVLMAGPCSVESRELAMEAARAVREAGGQLLRGGAFK